MWRVNQPTGETFVVTVEKQQAKRPVLKTWGKTGGASFAADNETRVHAPATSHRTWSEVVKAKSKGPTSTNDVNMSSPAATPRSVGRDHKTQPRPVPSHTRTLDDNRLTQIEQTLQAICSALQASGILCNSVPAASAPACRKRPAPEEPEKHEPPANIKIFSRSMQWTELRAKGELYRVPKDGNCLFWALADLLSPTDEEWAAAQLRALLCSLLEKPQWQQAVAGLLDIPIDQWRQTMKTDGTWGCEVAALVLCHALQPTRPVLIYHKQKSLLHRLEWDGQHMDSIPIVLQWDSDHYSPFHWDAAEPMPVVDEETDKFTRSCGGGRA